MKQSMLIGAVACACMLLMAGVAFPDEPDRDIGEQLFMKHCNICHNPFSTNWKNGPGLKGILKRTSLPDSGWAATPDNVRKILRTPYEAMPSFRHLSDEDVEHLIEYLKTL